MEAMDESVEVDDFFLVNFEEKAVKVEQECPLDAANVSRKHEKIIQRKCLENDKTKAKLREISKEKTDLTTKCESLIRQVQDLEEDKASMVEQADLKLISEFKSLQNKLEESETNVERLQNKLEESSNRALRSLNTTVKDLNQKNVKKVQEHKKVVERYQRENEGLRSNLRESLIAKESAEKVAENMKNNIIQERVKLNKLKSKYQVKIENLQMEAEKATERLAKERDKLKNENHAQIESLQMEHRKKTAQLIEVMEALNNESHSKIENLQIQLEEKDKIINEVTQENDKLKTECLTHEKKAADLIEERVRLDALNSESRSKIESLQKQLEEKDNSIKKVTQEKDKLKSECLTHEEKVVDLIAERVRLEAFKTEAQSKIESLQNQLEVKANVIIEITQERDKLETEALTHYEQVVESQSKVECLQNQLEVKCNVIIEMTQERDKLETEALTHYEQSLESQSKIECLQQKHDEFTTEAEELDCMRQVKIESLQNQLKESTITAFSSSITINELNQQKENIRTESQVQIESLQYKLEESLNAAQNMMNNIIQERVQLEKVKIESQIEIKRLQNQLEKYMNNNVNEFFDSTEEWKIEDFSGDLDEEQDNEDFIKELNSENFNEKLRIEGSQSLKRKMDNNASEVPYPKKKRQSKRSKNFRKRQAISWP